MQQNYVFVVDTNRQQLNPVTPKQARRLLEKGKAAVFRMYPFTLILKTVIDNPIIRPLALKIDPGSKFTGIALLDGENVIWAAELEHRGYQIKDACNQKKGNKPVEEFLKKKPELLKKIKSKAKKTLHDAAAVNATRNKLVKVLSGSLPTRTATGAQTKYNRIRLNLDKKHWIDAACVGDIDNLKLLTNQPLKIKCNGHGTRQMCRTDKYCFPSRYVPRFKFVKGFQTGDIVKAVVTSGKKIGEYMGRIATRSTGSFNISTREKIVQGISYKYCKTVHKKDGYSYAF
mgnify:CR=1 FL=1